MAEKALPFWEAGNQTAALESVNLMSAVRSMRVARDSLRDTLGADYVADVPLQLLLVLVEAHAVNRPVTAIHAATTIDVPLTVVDRWLSALEKQRMVLHTGTYVALSPHGWQVMTAAVRGVIASQVALYDIGAR